MKMDEENRKKLEKFWKKRMWLAIGTVGALGLAAWRVTAVQSRYDDLLVQESLDLPEKVYQELVAEVRKGIPILPEHPPGSDLSKYREKAATRCDSILALGFLGDARAVPELGKLLNDDMNRAKSCHNKFVFHQNSQENSAYVAAISALNQFDTPEAFAYFKASASKPPSPKLINIWRDFSHRTYEFSRMYPSDEQVIKYDTQPLSVFASSPKISNQNNTAIKLFREGALDSTKRRDIHVANQEKMQSDHTQQEREQAREELFKSYFGDVLALQTASLPPRLRDRINDKTLQEFVMKKLNKNIVIPPKPSEREDALLREMMKLANVRKEIIDAFKRDENRQKSGTTLFLLRYNLSRLIPGDYTLSNILFNVLVLDVEKGRTVDLDRFQVLPSVNSFSYNKDDIQRLTKLSSSSNLTIGRNAKIALEIINGKLVRGGESNSHALVAGISRHKSTDRPAESMTAQLIVPSLKSLNQSQRLNHQYEQREDVLVALEALADKGLIGDKDRKASNCSTGA
jgi:hypothetical protein